MNTKLKNALKQCSRVIVAASFIVLAACGGSEDKEAAKTEQKEKHSDADQPGSHENESAETVRIKLTPEARKAANLVTATAGPATLKETIQLYGVVKPNAERVRSVGARFPGVVRSVGVKIGDTVSQGATLATVESNESLQEYAVRSPLGGVVTERLTNPGEVAESQPLFTVADLNSVWVELSLFPRDRSRIRVGQMVRVKTTDEGLVSEGKIVFVSPLGTAQTQRLTARVLLDNRDQRWSPGLYVRGEVAVGEASVPIAVPAVALQELEDGTSVFLDGGQEIEARLVSVGRSDGDVTEILAGLSGGETVVGKGSFVLKAEMGKGEAEHDH